MSQLTITNFRNNIYNIIDRVIDTGIPKTIESKDHKVKIIVDDEIRSKFSNLEKMPPTPSPLPFIIEQESTIV